MPMLRCRVPSKGISIGWPKATWNACRLSSGCSPASASFPPSMPTGAGKGIAPLPDGSRGATYETRPQHELVISRDNVAVFAEIIGFSETAKRERLARLLDSYGRSRIANASRLPLPPSNPAAAKGL